jgi:hypothetical protein
METTWKRITAFRWIHPDWLDPPPDATRLDPYLIWGDVTGFADAPKAKHDDRLVLLLELKNGCTAKKFAEEFPPGSGVDVPDVYRHPAAGLEDSRFCTAAVNMAVLAKELQRPGTVLRWVERFELGLSLVPIAKGGFDAPGKSTGSGTAPLVLGVIDDGLPFAHERFRAQDRRLTRIEYLWNQNEPKPPYTRIHNRAAGFDYGTEITKGRIDGYLSTASDEDDVYRQAQHPGVGRRFSHGAHVMDLACGLAPARVDETSARIVCVQPQLASGKTRDTSGRWLGVHMLDGLRYILDRADRIARRDSSAECGPVVVNMSYGNIAGPHDGSSILEAAIDELICLRSALGEREHRNTRLSVAIPAGNHHLARCHASFSLGTGDEQPLHWRVLPDDGTPSFLEIWPTFGTGSPDLQVQVTTPWGDRSGWIKRKEVHACKLGETAFATVAHLERVATGNGPMILVALAPTATFDSNRIVPPCGTWEVRLRNGGTASVKIDAWIQRDETAYGYARRGRQSRFEDPKYERFHAIANLEKRHAAGKLKEEDDVAPYDPKKDDDGKPYVKRAGTMNAIATGKFTVIVGGYRVSDGEAARYSACGPTRSNARSGPDVLAPTERSAVRHGILAAGTRSGSVVAASGTSIAVPKGIRWRATEIAKLPTIPADCLDERLTVKEAVASHEQDPERPPRAPTLPKERGGAGRINRRKVKPPFRLAPDPWPEDRSDG